MNNIIPSLNPTPVAKLTFIVIAFICTSKCVKRNKLLYCSVYDQFYNRYNHRFGSLLPWPLSWSCYFCRFPCQINLQQSHWNVKQKYILWLIILIVLSFVAIWNPYFILKYIKWNKRYICICCSCLLPTFKDRIIF